MASIEINISTTREQTSMLIENNTDYVAEGITASSLTSATLKLYLSDLVTPYVTYTLSTDELDSFKNDMLVSLNISSVFGSISQVDSYYVCQIEFNSPHISNTEGLGLFKIAMNKVFEQQDLIILNASNVEVSGTTHYLSMLLSEMEAMSGGDVLSRKDDFDARLNTIQRILNY